MSTKTICVCGGGSLGHVISGYISAKNKAIVNVLTRHPENWSKDLKISLPNDEIITGNIHSISSNPKDVISQADVVLFSLPGYAIPEELDKIAPYIKNDAMIGTVFSSTGFFQEAFKRLPGNVGLWGLQRVPFIARVKEYGKSAKLLSKKDCIQIAVERCEDKRIFSQMIGDWFDESVELLHSWMEAAITNSNPLLHTSRLYTMFKEWNPSIVYPKQFLFYEEWTDEASKLLVEMDKELFSLIENLPVNKNYIDTILDHYEAKTPEEMTKKIQSINSFKGIVTPMKQTENGWIPDLNSRYFVEDFQYGLKYIKQLMMEYHVSSPRINQVMDWYSNLLNG